MEDLDIALFVTTRHSADSSPGRSRLAPRQQPPHTIWCCVIDRMNRYTVMYARATNHSYSRIVAQRHHGSGVVPVFRTTYCQHAADARCVRCKYWCAAAWLLAADGTAARPLSASKLPFGLPSGPATRPALCSWDRFKTGARLFRGTCSRLPPTTCSLPGIPSFLPGPTSSATASTLSSDKPACFLASTGENRLCGTFFAGGLKPLPRINGFWLLDGAYALHVYRCVCGGALTLRALHANAAIAHLTPQWALARRDAGGDSDKLSHVNVRSFFCADL